MGVTETRVRGIGLSSRITLVTFIVVTVAAALVSVIALVGVYHTARSEDRARLDAFRMLVSGDLDSRFGSVERVVGRLASDIGAAPGGLADTAADVREVLESEAAAFDTLMVIDGTGASRTGAAATEVPREVLESVMRSPADGPTLAWASSAPGIPERLWVGCPTRSEDGSAAVIGRVREAFLTRTLDGVVLAEGSVAAVVFDREGHPVLTAAGVSRVDLGAIELAAAEDGEGMGTVTASSPGSGSWSGSWERMVPDHGLGWRVAVFEADSGILARSAGALVPALLAMLLVVVLAVLYALLYSRRLLRPLTVIEQHARALAMDGYTKPLRVTHDDEMGRVAEAFNQLGGRLDSLQDMARLLATASSLDDVLDAVLVAIGRILGTGETAVLLADASGLAMSLERGKGLAAPSMTLLVPLDEPSLFATAFLEQRVIAFTADSHGEADSIHRLFGADSGRAGAVVPLTIGPEGIGVVVVLAPGRRAFAEAQIETLRVFSANAAVAVRTSRLFANERLSRTEAEALRAVAELTVGSGDIGRALDSSAAIAAELLGYPAWTVVLENRQQLGLGVPADREADLRMVEAWRMVESGRGEAGAPHAPVVVEDVRRSRDLAALTGPGWGSAIFIPVMQGSIARGALVLHDRTRMRRPTNRQVSVAGTISRQVSLAIRSAYLLQQARTRAANLETVFRISQAVSSELQLSAVLNRVLDVVQKILSADAVALMSYDPERHVIETSMARGVPSSDMLYFHTQPGEDIPGRVFALGVPVSYGDLSSRPTPLARMAALQGFESLLAVPLMARGRPIGVLAVYSTSASAFSGEDVELLLTFAAQAALAVDTASLYGKEHHVASVLQASILPERLPIVPGLEMASFYLPSGVEAEIGGDYYDVFTTHDGLTVLAIGDVCGKGVSAATKTSMVKYTLRGLIGAGAGPGRALAELNRQVSSTGDPSDIVTMWVGVLDARTGRLTYADGGHPPGLLLRAGTRSMERLSATGPLLGAISCVEYEEREVVVGIGDLVLLYTDGITEARRSARLFGEGRVRRVMRRSATAHECLDLLLATIKSYSVGPLKDDAAALAVRRIDQMSEPARVGDGEVG